MNNNCPVCGDPIAQSAPVILRDDGDVPGEGAHYAIHATCAHGPEGLPLYTPAAILAASGEALERLSEAFSNGAPFCYQLTAGELGWLDFVRGRYDIADYIYNRLDGDIVTFSDSYELGETLDGDGGGGAFAVCLSQDTALARLFFWIYQPSV